jgi:hypothetical protein
LFRIDNKKEHPQRMLMITVISPMANIPAPYRRLASGRRSAAQMRTQFAPYLEKTVKSSALREDGFSREARRQQKRASTKDALFCW